MAFFKYFHFFFKLSSLKHEYPKRMLLRKNKRFLSNISGWEAELLHTDFVERDFLKIQVYF